MRKATVGDLLAALFYVVADEKDGQMEIPTKKLAGRVANVTARFERRPDPEDKDKQITVLVVKADDSLTEAEVQKKADERPRIIHPGTDLKIVN